jgi:hypothetical protein
MVAPVHNFDHKILPEGSGKLRWAAQVRWILYIFGGRLRSSEAAMGRGGGGRAAPCFAWQ